MFGAVIEDDVDRRVVDDRAPVGRPRRTRTSRAPRRGARARVSLQTTSSGSNVRSREERGDPQHRAAVGLPEPAEADHADADAPARPRRPGARDGLPRRRSSAAYSSAPLELVGQRIELGAAGHHAYQLVAA